ncbi:MAG: PLP-dependent lyase/thiolase, partial [Clostridia bacterium]|nr:PLP-dependent lyase/thiolase [Clostridia bacterium]
MSRDKSYAAVMARKNEIMKKALGVDYEEYELSDIAFDYDTLMEDVHLTMEDIRRIQREVSVGDTPLVELRNLTALARKFSEPGKGARIFIKDEAGNPSGSFKD